MGAPRFLVPGHFNGTSSESGFPLAANTDPAYLLLSSCSKSAGTAPASTGQMQDAHRTSCSPAADACTATSRDERDPRAQTVRHAQAHRCRASPVTFPTTPVPRGAVN